MFTDFVNNMIEQEFKILVEAILDKFVTDLGIDPQVFVNACELASEKIHKSIINQLLAVENFLLFKKMMIARNKQLNQEAMKHVKEQLEMMDEDLEEQAEREREEAELAQAIAES